MYRTQIQLTEVQRKTLSKVSKAQKQSVAEVIRDMLEQHLVKPLDEQRKKRVQQLKALAGIAHSKVTDLARNHDKYLADAGS